MSSLVSLISPFAPGPHAQPGTFITLEGGEGVGKTTQGKLLFKALCARGIPCCVTRQPGGTTLGGNVRTLLFEEGWDPFEELFLVLADRHHHMRTFITPHLDKGYWVICDRYIDSSIVYQGFTLVEHILQPWHTWAKGTKPMHSEHTVVHTLSQLIDMTLWPWNAQGRWREEVPFPHTAHQERAPSGSTPASHELMPPPEELVHYVMHCKEHNAELVTRYASPSCLWPTHIADKEKASEDRNAMHQWMFYPLWPCGPTFIQLREALRFCVTSWIYTLHKMMGIWRMPDVTLLLRQSVVHALTRRRNNVASCNKFDRAKLARHYAIARGFRFLANIYPQRFVMLEENVRKNHISAAVIAALEERFPHMPPPEPSNLFTLDHQMHTTP